MLYDYENFRLPFGKHKGKCLKDVSLLYLDEFRKKDLYAETKEAIEGYLRTPAIEEKLYELSDKKIRQAHYTRVRYNL